MSDGLPDGWTNATLAELVGFALGGDWGKDSDEIVDGMVRVRVIRGTDFRHWRTNKASSAAQRCIKVASLERRRLRKGDIVLEVSGGGPQQPVGRTVLIDDETLKQADAPLVCSNFFRLLRFSPAIDFQYINHFLSYAYARGDFNEFQTETTNLRNLNVTDFLNETEVALAPLAEQRRIAAQLEATIEKVDACQDRLAKIPTILKRFRKSVLAAACSGRLTADWREEHSELQPVTHVVDQLFQDRFAHAETTAKAQRLESIKKHREENHLDDLPKTWRYVALDKVCESFNYGTSTKSRVTGTMPVLRMGNIQNGEIDWSDLVYTSDKSEIAKYRLKPNSVLFNRTNSPELVGKTAIYRGERPAIFAGYLIRINPFDNILSPEYLNYSLNTMYARDFCLEVKSDGVSQSNINAQKLGKFEVALPPFAEQQEIVRRVAALFKGAEVIETQFSQAQAQVDKLTPSLLAKAFRGELVSTEAVVAKAEGRGFESAEELLKRIPINGNGAAATLPARANRRRTR